MIDRQTELERVLKKAAKQDKAKSKPAPNPSICLDQPQFHETGEEHILKLGQNNQSSNIEI
jgi:hypothetical protein